METVNTPEVALVDRKALSARIAERAIGRFEMDDLEEIRFKDLLKVPSAAIRAMVEGLREAPIEIRMGTFGAVDYHLDCFTPPSSENQTICFGCAATCTVLRLLPSARDKYFDLRNKSDLGEFEDAIDELRTGHPGDLIDYFDLPSAEVDEIYRRAQFFGLPHLVSDFNPEDLIPYERFADRLEEIGC